MSKLSPDPLQDYDRAERLTAQISQRTLLIILPLVFATFVTGVNNTSHSDCAPSPLFDCSPSPLSDCSPLPLSDFSPSPLSDCFPSSLSDCSLVTSLCLLSVTSLWLHSFTSLGLLSLISLWLLHSSLADWPTYFSLTSTHVSLTFPLYSPPFSDRSIYFSLTSNHLSLTAPFISLWLLHLPLSLTTPVTFLW